MNILQKIIIYSIVVLFIIVSSYILFRPYYTALKNGGKALMIPQKKNFLFLVFILVVSLLLILRIVKKWGVISGICLLSTILYTALINIYPHIIFQNGILHYTEFIEWKNIKKIIIVQNTVTVYISFTRARKWKFKICGVNKERLLKILDTKSVLVELG